MDQLKTLSAEEITDVVKGFLDNQLYNSALLIDGKWGTGKTYFLKTTLIPKIKEHGPKRPLYVSLNGINSIEEIKNQITVSFITEMARGDGDETSLRKKVNQDNIQKLGTFLRVGKSVLNKFIDIDSMKINIGDYLDFSKFVLIFDDLERCACPINEVMGYLNNFVEHQGTKVILIANENEICGGYDKEERDKYDKIKEKLVGHTIRYNPSLINIYEKLIETHVHDENLKKLLKEHIGSDVEYAENLEHPNIRTYQFYLEKIMGLYNSLGDCKDNADLLSKIRLYTYLMCVRYKAGKDENKWSKTNVYGKFNLLGEEIYGEKVLGFKFIDDYIQAGYLDTISMSGALNKYLSDVALEFKEAQNPLKISQNWWMLSEEEINQNLQDICSLLAKNEYDFETYPKILQLLSRFEVMGLDTKGINKILDQMIDNIKTCCESEIRDIDFYDEFIDDEIVSKKYLEYVEIVKSSMFSQRTKHRLKVIEECLEDKNWGEKLYEFVATTSNTKEQSYIKDINIDDLYRKIIQSDNKNLVRCIQSISRIYHFSNVKDYYSEDIANLEALLKKLKNTDLSKFDVIKTYNLKEFIKILENKIELFKE